MFPLVPVKNTMGESMRFEYFILPEIFRAEACQGFDYKTVARVLLGHGCLLPDKGRALDTRQRLPGMGLGWCYRILPSLFELDLRVTLCQRGVHYLPEALDGGI